MKYAWIAGHKARWPITLTCEVLEVSASGYFEHWRRRDADKPSRPGVNKRISDEALLVHIKAIHAEVKQEYGWPKMWKELLARGIRVGKERVRRLMQRHGTAEGRQAVRQTVCYPARGHGRGDRWLTFYNHKRLHSTLGYVSPMTFEQRWIAAQQQNRKSAS